MFRDLIPALADDYHVMAPDLPGFGFSATPDRAQFRYTFDHPADAIALLAAASPGTQVPPKDDRSLVQKRRGAP